MTYRRTIPRDLFNEADLLKCLGQLYLLLERRPTGVLFMPEGADGFDIRQDPADGSITARNVRLIVKGREYNVYRPLNSREPWPLWLSSDEDEEVDFQVFDTDHLETAGPGLSEEMLTLLGVYDEEPQP